MNKKKEIGELQEDIFYLKVCAMFLLTACILSMIFYPSEKSIKEDFVWHPAECHNEIINGYESYNTLPTLKENQTVGILTGGSSGKLVKIYLYDKVCNDAYWEIIE